MSSREGSEVHFYAILEGTGHLQRVLELYRFLGKRFSCLKLFIIPGSSLENSQEFLQTFFSRQKFPVMWEFRESPRDFSRESKKFFVIMDIRDRNPGMFLKSYPPSTSFFSLDNYYRKKYRNITYWYALPHPRSFLPVTESLKHHFFAKAFIKIRRKHIALQPKVLLYLGLEQSHFLIDALQDEEVKKNLHLQNKEIITIGRNSYVPKNQFYTLLKESEIVITYPGQLFYESMILGKTILAHHLHSRIHRLLLFRIIKECSVYFVKKIPVRKKENFLYLYLFDFSRFPSENINLSTPYRKLWNWIKEQNYGTK